MKVRQLEAELQNRELRIRLDECGSRSAFLTTIIENMLDLVSFADLEGNLRFVGKSHEMFGYDPEFLVGKNVFAFVHPDDLHRVLQAYKALVGSDDPARIEYRFRCADGSYLWLETRGVYVKDQNGRAQGVIFSSRDVTGQRQTREALEKSEEKFRYLFEKAEEGILVVRGEVLEFVNPAVERILGYCAARITAAPFTVFIHPDDRDTMRDLHLRAMQGEFREKQSDFRVITADGAVKWLRVHGQIIDWEGAPANLSFLTDITESKLAQQQLIESEKRFAKAFRSSPAPQVISDIETGEFIDVNDRWVNMLGYTKEQSIGRSSKEVGIWTDPAERDRIVEKLNKHGFFKDEPVEFKTKHGKVVHALWSGEAVNLGDRPVMLSMLYDRTAQKQMEDALRQSEQRLSLALDAVSDGVWDWRTDINEVYFSPRWYTMLGYEPYELPETYATWRRLLHPDDLEKAESVVLRHLTSTAPFALEFRMKTKEGGFKWILDRGKTVEKDVKGNARRMLGTHIDITKRKQAEQEQEKLQAQLHQAQKMESVGRLAGGVAHDFNNMLSIINGYAELSIDMLESGGPLYENIREIYNAGRRSADIVRQLLAFARKQTISPVQMDLNDTVSGLLKMLQRLIGENIDLSWHPGGSLWPVKIDPSQVDQIMANLAVNARDAISDVGKMTIETRNVVIDQDYCRVYPYFVPGEYVMLAVSDNGCGMEKDVQKNLFEPFYTTKETGKGTGLGLSTIYGIVKQNNGFINVYSEPGQGSAFKIYLPRHEPEEAGQGSSAKSHEQMPTGTETILIVEDEAAIVHLTRGMLEKLGYAVITARKPEDALHLAASHEGRIDLLITDVVMPEMNGRDLSARLSVNNPALKTLFMSGYTADLIACHGVLDKGVQFIEKPFTQKDLAIKVRQALGQQNQQGGH
ncbi:PAS domain S-box-containing protein [Desulfosalsimonas propionicica]|uniref:histidine kinase n=1 Tax=Desulfosalsimonas propionicica TaxID=332175 RepID=A0A7W0CCC9_9BACT|nr:hybrid sensor histidine kinase/response regulator [Desulfosalsimonas propionicica]MBA2883154.1 PAS domain S-box-containing protein [Desulfosalsimonas propionicica]